jgi:iron complex outermembrane receptor protein
MLFHKFFAARTVPLITACLLAGTAASATPDDTARNADEVAPAPIETIVVTGTQTSLESARTEAAFTPGGVDVIDMDAFRESNVSSLADVLRYAPGVWATSDFGTDSIYFSSRGSNLDSTDYDMNGIKLLQDGLPVTAADGNNHNRMVDPLSARYATVARGANAMSWGASTLGGAINFETVTARDVPRAEAYLNGGSFGQEVLRITGGRVFGPTADALVTVDYKNWDGYREHSEQQRRGIYANAGWQPSARIATRFYLTWVNNEQNLPRSLSRAQMADPTQAGATAIEGNHQVNVEALRLAGKATWQIDEARQLEFGVSWEAQSLYHPIVAPVMVDFDGPGPAEPVEVFSLLIDTDHRDLGATVRYRQAIGDHELLVGAILGNGAVTGGHYRNQHGYRNGLTTNIDDSAGSLEAFVMDRWQFRDNWTLVTAAQLVHARRDVRSTDVASGTVSNPVANYSGFNPRVGLVYELRDDVSLYGNVSRLFEAPTNFQLEDNVAGGDATLKPMTGSVVEIGTRGGSDFGTGDYWGWDVSLYYAAIRDEILSVEDPAAPGTSLATNRDKTVHTGLEASLNLSLGLDNNGVHTLEPRVSLTVNRFNFDGDAVYGDNQLPAAPDYALRGEMMYRNAAGWFVGPTLEWVGARYADFANTYTVDSYHLLGLRGGWSSDDWDIYADLGNLSDENYVANHSVRNVAGVDDAILNPGAPRSVFIGVQHRFR